MLYSGDIMDDEYEWLADVNDKRLEKDEEDVFNQSGVDGWTLLVR